MEICMGISGFVVDGGQEVAMGKRDVDIKESNGKG